jgi:lipopolysaccharide/colanic/teichoic acid biosynthesis glycosyltransferase
MAEARSATHRGIPRALEALLAAGGLIISLPALAVAAVLVRATSRGPAIFRQQRVGRGGRPFTLYKLRTMRVSAEGPQVTARGDDRITPVGRFLRRSKLDELPQLWNVVRGDMTLVGPRPEVARYVDMQDPAWQRVLRVRPGITDPVTLRLRDEEALLAGVEGDRERFYREELQPGKLREYGAYLESRSAWTDVEVLYKTILAVLFPGRGAGPRPLPGEASSESPSKQAADGHSVAKSGRFL